MPRQAVLVRSLTLFASVSLLAFICWLIYLADAGKGPSNVLFRLSYQVPYGDKAGHLLLFGPLAFTANATLQFRKIHLPLNVGHIHLGSLLVIIFVLIEELSQHFFPNRTVELLDLLADGAGIALFTWFSLLFERKMRRRNSSAPSYPPVSP